MKNLKMLVSLVISFCLLVCLYLISSNINKPPSFSSVQAKFGYYKEDIQLVLNYIINCDCEDIYFIEEAGKVVADFQELEINQCSVKVSVNRLVNSGDILEISKEGGTVIFEMWNGVLDIGCGVAYSINCNEYPEIQFQTELVPLSEPGWYYYVYDYNKWRRSQ